MRLFSVHGPRERPEKLFMKLMNHKRSFTYIDDIIAGLVAVVDHRKECIGEVFNIGSDTNTTTGEGIAIVEKLLNRKARIKTLPPRRGDQYHTYAQIGKAKFILGYTPRTCLENALSKQVTWYKKSLRK